MHPVLIHQIIVSLINILVACLGAGLQSWTSSYWQVAPEIVDCSYSKLNNLF
uniref:Uncharacterized protein n=1 Tax=Nelumbo nucifera TaxID=4432 RepID=A0A822YYT6_NELNU|nr:TPA_asm: hypothetical protein HUJ06_008337 [Nelumbo nucifera]DAD37697.1 TPA_asm: hypothetical protein HUJ06_008338 [Nelumbo nucifera]DAD37698.1 TPA_asm: hypothetical protein HUJ06_008339 [Nelumbo nucifera]DAD37699.1 TPA_asm: hypothetical protein HUJ06_008340 [Nelumbo nucifera]DAD37700.1 TPA_asm: hypothetical protein HUJ06_008341 [Nelumbo nucifera]